MSVPTLPLPNEDQIDLQSSIFSVTEANTRIANGTDLLLLDGSSMPSNLGTIPVEELKDLYKEVKNYCTPDKDAITALRVHFGASDASGSISLKLFYDAMFLKLDHIEPISGDRVYKTNKTGKLYSFNGTSFVAETETSFNTAKSLYETSFSIKHTVDAEVYDDYISGEDTLSLVIPFQLLFNLMKDNENTQFNINNCAELKDDGAGTFVRHSLIMNSSEISSNGDFAGKFANRNHGCPPKINSFPYQII